MSFVEVFCSPLNARSHTDPAGWQVIHRASTGPLSTRSD